jgi:plasmid maintenance system killer protein
MGVFGGPRPAGNTRFKKNWVLDGAEILQDLRIPPGNLLEKLSGDRGGQYSIRNNDNGEFVLFGGKKMLMKWKSRIITNHLYDDGFLHRSVKNG